MSNLIKNQNKIAFFNIISTILLQGLTFFVAPYFSRVLGTANYGIVSVFNAWVQIISLVLGLRLSSAIAFGKTEYPDEEQESFQASLIGLSIFSFLLFSPLILWLSVVYFQANFYYVCWMLVCSFGLHCVSFANNKFTYEFRADINFYMTSVLSIITIVFSIFLINWFADIDGYWGRIWGMAIPNFLMGCGICFYIYHKSNNLCNRKYWNFALPLTIPLVLHGVSGIIFHQSDRIMIKWLIGDSSAGIYSLSHMFSNVVFVVWTALNNTWVPLFFEKYKNNNLDSINEHTKYYLELFSVITIGFIFMSPEVFKIFASEEYWEGLRYIYWFSIGMFFVFLYGFPINFEIYHKKTKTIAMGSLLTAVINIVLNYILIQKLHILGGVISTVISYIIQFLYQHFASMKNNKNNVVYPFDLLTFLPNILLVISASLLLHFWGVDDTVGFRWFFVFFMIVWELYRIKVRKVIF